MRQPVRCPFAAVALLSLASVLACSDDKETGSAPSSDTGAADTSAGQDSAQADDTAVDDFGGEDAGGDTGGPICFPEDGERQVGDQCARETDRICLDDSHCRETERCEREGGEEMGTCIYQIPEPIECPGGATCPQPQGDPPLRAGFAIRAITPTGFEEPRPEFIDDEQIFVGDTEDPETFFDCGRDMICPGDGGYSGPDADGSEGDGYLQGAWMAGLDNSKSILRCTAEYLGESCTLGLECCAHEMAHDDVWARGVIFEQADSKVAIVVVDLVGFFYSDIQRIAARIPESLGIDLLVMSATHNHEGPDSMGLWGPGSFGGDLPLETGVDAAHMAFIHDQVLDLLEEANDNLVPVDVYATQLDSGYEGLALRDSRDPFIIDDDLAVMQVVRAGTDRSDPQNNVGAIVNWGNHPESIGYDNQHISSDYPHYVRHYVENGLPEVAGEGGPLAAVPGLEAPTLFISSAVGGLVTPLRRSATRRDGTVIDQDGYAKADAMGQQIALATLVALADAPQISPALSFGGHEFMVDVVNLQFKTGIFSLDLFDRELYNWRHADGFTLTDPAPKMLSAVARIQLGEVTFATVPGEIFPETMSGGFNADDAVSAPVWGDPERTQCMDDRLPPGEGDNVEDATHPCLIDPANPNPPDLSAAPTGGFLRGELPGDVLFLVGLGQDEFGYLVPPYDFKVLEGAEYVGEPDGDHYEETNSAGPAALPTVLRNLEVLFDLESNSLFVRE